jgi:hypothetical protein
MLAFEAGYNMVKAAEGPENVWPLAGQFLGRALLSAPVGSITGGLSSAAQPFASLAGQMSSATPESVREAGGKWYNMVPVLSDYALGSREAVTSDEFAEDRAKAGVGSKLLREYLLGIGNALGASALGALAGGAIGGGGGALAGAAIGGGGATIAQGAGSLTGLLRSRRTREQQRDYETSGAGTSLAHLLVPGYAGHQLGRRLRYSTHYDS